MFHIDSLRITEPVNTVRTDIFYSSLTVTGWGTVLGLTIWQLGDGNIVLQCSFQYSIVQSSLKYFLQFSRVLCRVQCCSVSCKQVDRQAAGTSVSDSRRVTALDGGEDQDTWQWGGHGKKRNNRLFNVFMHLYIVFFVWQYLWQKYML